MDQELPPFIVKGIRCGAHDGACRSCSIGLRYVTDDCGNYAQQIGHNGSLPLLSAPGYQVEVGSNPGLVDVIHVQASPAAVNDFKHRHDGLIYITSQEYDDLIEATPHASLQYIDEDDGECVVVGSSLELQQRLQDAPQSGDYGAKEHLLDRRESNLQSFTIRHHLEVIQEWQALDGASCSQNCHLTHRCTPLIRDMRLAVHPTPVLTGSQELLQQPRVDGAIGSTESNQYYGLRESLDSRELSTVHQVPSVSQASLNDTAKPWFPIEPAWTVRSLLDGFEEFRQIAMTQNNRPCEELPSMTQTPAQRETRQDTALAPEHQPLLQIFEAQIARLQASPATIRKSTPSQQVTKRQETSPFYLSTSWARGKWRNLENQMQEAVDQFPNWGELAQSPHNSLERVTCTENTGSQRSESIQSETISGRLHEVSVENPLKHLAQLAVGVSNLLARSYRPSQGSVSLPNESTTKQEDVVKKDSNNVQSAHSASAHKVDDTRHLDNKLNPNELPREIRESSSAPTPVVSKEESKVVSRQESKARLNRKHVSLLHAQLHSCFFSSRHAPDHSELVFAAACLNLLDLFPSGYTIDKHRIIKTLKTISRMPEVPGDSQFDFRHRCTLLVEKFTIGETLEKDLVTSDCVENLEHVRIRHVLGTVTDKQPLEMSSKIQRLPDTSRKGMDVQEPNSFNCIGKQIHFASTHAAIIKDASSPARENDDLGAQDELFHTTKDHTPPVVASLKQALVKASPSSTLIYPHSRELSPTTTGELSPAIRLTDHDRMIDQTVWEECAKTGNERDTPSSTRDHENRITETRATFLAAANRSRAPFRLQPAKPNKGKQRAIPVYGDAHDLVISDSWDWGLCGTSALVQQDWTKWGDGEIDLEKGDYVTIMARVNELWWYGTNRGGVSGLFPQGYVDVLTDEDVRCTGSLEMRTSTTTLPLQPATTPSVWSGARVQMPEPPLSRSACPLPTTTQGSEIQLANQYGYIAADELYDESAILEAPLKIDPAAHKPATRHTKTWRAADGAAAASSSTPSDAPLLRCMRKDLIATRISLFDTATLRCFTQLVDMGYGDSVGLWTLADHVEASKGNLETVVDRLLVVEEQRRER